MATDPVCGMSVDEKSAATTRVHAGRTYYFCSERCASKFEADPAAYVKKPEPARAQEPHRHGSGTVSAHPPAAIYTCPMHPEVRQQGARCLPEMRHGA